MNRRGPKALLLSALISIAAVSIVAVPVSAQPQIEVTVSNVPAEVTPGETFTVTYSLENTGSEDANGGGVQLLQPSGGLSIQSFSSNEPDSAKLNGSSQSGVVFLNFVDPGEIKEVTVTYEVADDATAGTAEISATGFLDGTTFNQTVSRTVQVVEQIPPDFQVASLAPPSGPVTEGDNFTVVATIANQGRNGTQTIELRFDSDGDGTLQSDEVVRTRELSLNTSESQQVAFELNSSTLGVAPGTYDHGVFTENDSAVAPVTIQSPDPVVVLAGGDRRFSFTEVLTAISIFNTDGTVAGETLSFSDVLEIIDAFNTDRQVGS